MTPIAQMVEKLFGWNTMTPIIKVKAQFATQLLQKMKPYFVAIIFINIF